MRPLTLAAAQAVAHPGDVAANCETAARLIREAGRSGAALVVFPELFLCGYDLERVADLEPDDPRLEPLRIACRESGTHAVVGASLREGEDRLLAALIVDARGTVRGRYAKRHLWGAERDLFAVGEEAVTLQLGGWRLALGLCVEASIPEHARAAARDGAHAYLTAGAFAREPEILHAARARENALYAAVANHVGNGFCGHSAVYDPAGDCVARLDGGEEGLAIAELHPAAVDREHERLKAIDERPPAARRVEVEL